MWEGVKRDRGERGEGDECRVMWLVKCTSISYAAYWQIIRHDILTLFINLYREQNRLL